ncbi:TPA: hypothetical protein JBH09_13755, partial [Legionella pneumophila]|nr:hypothetical protein [Legionella pneumophila]
MSKIAQLRIQEKNKKKFIGKTLDEIEHSIDIGGYYGTNKKDAISYINYCKRVLEQIQKNDHFKLRQIFSTFLLNKNNDVYFSLSELKAPSEEVLKTEVFDEILKAIIDTAYKNNWIKRSTLDFYSNLNFSDEGLIVFKKIQVSKFQKTKEWINSN